MPSVCSTEGFYYNVLPLEAYFHLIVNVVQICPLYKNWRKKKKKFIFIYQVACIFKVNFYQYFKSCLHILALRYGSSQKEKKKIAFSLCFFSDSCLLSLTRIIVLTDLTWHLLSVIYYFECKIKCFQSAVYYQFHSINI